MVPAFTLFTIHWYTGEVPPLVGVAVKVTEVPWQILLEEAVTETPTTKGVLTTMVMALEVAGLPTAQLPLAVRIQ